MFALEREGLVLVLAFGVDDGLGSGESCTGDTEGRAGDVVGTGSVEELDGLRITADFTADAAVEIGVGSLAFLDGKGDESSDTSGIDGLEGVEVEDLLVDVMGDEGRVVVSGEAVGELGEVIGSVGEVGGFGSKITGGDGGSRGLDHGTDDVLQLVVVGALGDDLVGGIGDELLDVFELLGLDDLRNHDGSGDVDLLAGSLVEFFLGTEGSLDDGRGLHDTDLRIDDVETAASETHHGVGHVELVDAGLDLFDGLSGQSGKLGDILFLSGEVFIERRIEETDVDVDAAEGEIHVVEVVLLIRLQLVEPLDALFGGISKDHLLHGDETIATTEHMLGTAQTDTLGAEFDGLESLFGRIGVGIDVQFGIFVGPLQDLAEVAGEGGLFGGDGAIVDFAGGSVDGDDIAFVVDLAADRHGLVDFIDDGFAASGDAALADLTGNDSGVGGHSASHGKDTLSGDHAIEIVRRGFGSDENHLALLVGGKLGLGFLGGEDESTDGSARGSGVAVADDDGLLEGRGDEGRMENLIEGARIDSQESFLLVDEAFLDEIGGNLEAGGSGSLAVSGLQEVENAVFDGELEVLHILIMLFQLLGRLHELVVDLGLLLLQGIDVQRGADAGDDVFALSVDEVFGKDFVLAVGGVTGEADTGSGVLAGVSEGHHLNVDGGSPRIGDVVHLTIEVGSFVVPRVEDGLDSGHQLIHGVDRELFAELALVVLFVLLDEGLELGNRDFEVILDMESFLDFVEHGIHVVSGDSLGDVGEHEDETTIAVIGESFVVGLLGEGFDGFVIETEIEDGVHHARHGNSGTGTNGDEKGVGALSESLSGSLLKSGNAFLDLVLEIGGDGSAGIVIKRASFGGDGEAIGDANADMGHFGQAGALTSEKRLS